MELSLCCGSRLGFASLIRWMRCCIIDGLIPWMSAMVQPMASLFFLNTVRRSSSCFTVNGEAMITGKSSFSPKYLYLRWLGIAFSSEEGIYSVEGCSCWKGLIGVAFVAHSTTESTIWSRLKSSDSNSNSYSDSYSGSCSLVNPSIKFTSNVWSAKSRDYFPRWKTFTSLVMSPNLIALTHSYNLW